MSDANVSGIVCCKGQHCLYHKAQSVAARVSNWLDACLFAGAEDCLTQTVRGARTGRQRGGQTGTAEAALVAGAPREVVGAPRGVGVQVGEAQNEECDDVHTAMTLE